MEYSGHNSFGRMEEVNYNCDGKFQGNILVVGRAGYGKTTFVQNLGKKNYSETSKRSIGSLKLNFLQTEKKVSRTVLKITLEILNTLIM